jgi:hypothetical protein
MRVNTAVALALAAGAVLSGCQAHMMASVEAEDGQTPGDDAVLSELRDHHRHHHRGGVIQFMAMSLDTLAVDDSRQGQVSKLQDDLYVCLAPTRAIESQLLLALADGVAAGSEVPGARVDESVARLNTAAGVLPECSADVLNQLHALLSPSERAALADKIEDHWEVWHQVNGDPEDGAQERRERRMASLTTELSLTPAQATSISTALEAARTGRSGASFDRQATAANLELFSTAFSSERFDARTITLTANAPLMAHGARRMARFYQTVTPLLTPEQRGTLARQLREHANHQPAVSAK